MLLRPEVVFALFLYAFVIRGGQLVLGGLNLTAVLLIATFVALIFPVLAGRPLRFSLRASDLFLLVFLLVLFVASYIAPDPSAGLRKASLFGTTVFVPYVIARLVFKTYAQIRTFLTVILIVATSIAFNLIALSLSSDYIGGRLQFFEANPIPTGTLMAVGSAIAAVGITSRLFRTRTAKAFCLLAVGACIYGLFLSGVRGPLIALLIGSAFYAFFALRSAARKLNVSIGAAVTGVIVVMTFNTWYPYIERSIPNVGSYRLQTIKEGLSTQQRIEEYRLASEMFFEHPLGGAGTSAFGLTVWGYPHNIFLEIASEMGLIGLFTFLCFLGAVMLSGVKYLSARRADGINVSAKAIGLTVIVVAITLLVGRQFSFALTMHKDLFVFLGIIVNLPSIHSAYLRRSQQINAQMSAETVPSRVIE